MERLADKPLIQCLAVTGNHSSSKTDPDREIRVNISHRVFIRPPTSIRLFIVALLFLASTLAGLAQNGAQKPAKTVIDGRYEAHRITVKFRDGLNVRLRDNALVSTDQTALTSARSLLGRLAAGHWERADAASEEKIDELRRRAQDRLGRALPDLNLQFYLALPAGMDAAETINQLNALDIVEMAQPVPRPPPPPTAPNYELRQTNCFPAPAGINAFGAWNQYGDYGAGVQIADLEGSFHATHHDFPLIINLDSSAIDPFHDDNHGTAVLGELCAQRNGWGITGIAPAASYYFSGVAFASGLATDRAITTALTVLGPGDVMILEQHIYGPNSTADTMATSSEYGMVPVEWFKPYYDRIVTAVGLGVIVVEAAGNGGQNLDDPIYRTGNGGNYPFLPQNNSGAIIVGAGAAASGSSVESSRLSFSDFGSRVDVQGWGEKVVTTGYGDLYSAEGADLYYSAKFSGTSSATPMIAGAVALLQSAWKNTYGGVLSPSQVKSLLQSTGSPQQNGHYRRFDGIGSLPNVTAAIDLALATWGPPSIVMESGNMTTLVGGNAMLSVAASGEPPLTYQWRLNGTNLVDGGSVYGSSNSTLTLVNLSSCGAGVYSAVISNALGAVTSLGIALSVGPDDSTAPGVTLTNIYAFTGNGDGSGAAGLVLGTDGNLYGVTQYGGDYGEGDVFRLTTAGAFNNLHSFSGMDDGAYPYSVLVQGQDGAFYGTTWSGGDYDAGTDFSITAGGTFSQLYSFSYGGDGGYPYAGLVLGSNGTLYGTTYAGGGRGYGTVFAVTPGGVTTLHSFDYIHGAYPYGELHWAVDGNLYGTT